MDVFTRLQALERAVAGLLAGRGGSAGSEAIQPTYLSVNAQGQISALFTGGLQLVEASGLSFPPPSTNSIQWHGAAANATESIAGTSLGGGIHDLVLRTNADANDIAQLELLAQAAGGLGSAQAKLTLNDNTGGTATFIVGTSRGASDFVQSNNKQGAATAGGATLPANPVGFLQFQDSGGNTFKVPYYAV